MSVEDPAAIDALNPIASPFELDSVLKHYREHGWARLGKVLSDEGAAALAARANAVMLGERQYDGLYFQHDARSGSYDDLSFRAGWQGPSLAYRKVDGMERDPLFRAWIENPLFAKVARALLGPTVRLYRALLMNKAAQGGTRLPWHQDGGRFWGLDRDPTLQLWTALDDAPVEAGCVAFVSGSHRGGLVTPFGGNVAESVTQAADAEARAELVPVRRGEVLLIHNHVWHRSGLNQTGQPRRALTLSLLDGETHCTRRKHAPRTFLELFSQGRSIA